MKQLLYRQELFFGAAVTILLMGCTRSERDVGSGSPLSSLVELDHFYIYAPAQSTEEAVIEAIEETGLNVSDYRNEFPDGVVGRYVMFHNGYLEVLWYDGNPDADAGTRRRAAWERTGASPFGVGLRRRAGTPEDLPIATRSYTAEWMEPGTTMRLLGAEDDTLTPALFVVPDYMAHPDSSTLSSVLSTLSPEQRAQWLEDRTHSLGVYQLTHGRLVVRSQGLSQAAQMLSRSGIVRIEPGDEPLLEISFDGSAAERVQDLRPVLSLLVRY